MGFKLRRKTEQPRRPLAPSVVNRAKPTYFGNDKPHSEDSVRARQITEQRRTIWKRLRTIPSLVALAAIIMSIGYNLTLSTTPGIIFSGSASIYQTAAEYKTGIAKILNASVLNKNKLTINTNKIQAEILRNFPELDAVNIGLPVVGRRPTATIHVREPALILTTKSNAFVLDTSGKVVVEAKQLISSVAGQLLTVQDQSGLVLQVGDQALTSSTVTFITNIKVQLTAKQLVIANMTIAGGGNQVDVHLKDIAYFLKTDSSGDARIQIGDFIAARDSGAAPAEYMDVRVEGKVFYK